MNETEKKNRIIKKLNEIRMNLDAISNGSDVDSRTINVMNLGFASYSLEKLKEEVDEFWKYENKLLWKSRKFNQNNNHHLDITLDDLDKFEKLSLLADIKEEWSGESLTNRYRVEPFNSYTHLEFTFSVSEQRSKSFLSNDTILFIVFGIQQINFRTSRVIYIQAIGMNGTYRFRVSNIFNYRKPYKKRLLQIEQNIIRKIQELGYKNL